MQLHQSLAAALLSLVSATAFAQFERCLDQFPSASVPIAKEVGRDLCFDSFAVYYSPTSKKPIYTVEKLNRARLEDAHEQRTNEFYEEARLRSNERAHLADYARSGYDRGHNAPAGDMPNPNAMAQSFSLANMMPQAPENNRGIWAKSVEKATRQYVLRRARGDVFVYTGSVGEAGRIGAGRVVVPTHIWKLVYDKERGEAWAYWVENSNYAKMSPPISYQEISRLTNIDFRLSVH
jgi:endonuclease G, mitochondrial